MGKWLAGISGILCALAASASAAPLPLTDWKYEQKWDGLAWSSTNVQQPGFGSASTGTEGWIAMWSAYSETYTTFRSRTASSPKQYATVAGAHSTNNPTDLAVSRHYQGMGGQLLFFLRNDTGKTITRAEISFDIELWVKPTANLSVANGIGAYYDIGNFWTGANPRSGVTFRPLYEHSFTTADAAGTELSVTRTLENINWPVGQSLGLFFVSASPTYDANHITGVDNISVVVPEPSVILALGVVTLSALSRRSRTRGAI